VNDSRSAKAYYISFCLWNSNKVDDVDIPMEGIQKFKWSPVGHAFAYVYEFDVYINTVKYQCFEVSYYLYNLYS